MCAIPERDQTLRKLGLSGQGKQGKLLAINPSTPGNQ